MGFSKIGAWAFVVLLFTGCKVTEKKAKEYAYSHKDKLAEWCADCFPVKESEVRVDTTFIRGKDSLRVDTVEADCPDGTKVKKNCPPCNVKTPDTIVVNKEIKVRDTAKEAVLENERDDYKDKWSQAEDSSNVWMKRAIWGWGILVALGIGIFLKWYIRNRTILRLK